MKKSISLLLAAVMVFALAAIACADATTVTAWISDGAETVIYTSMFDDFNSKHDDIQVDYQFFAQDELLNKLQTAPIVGDTPDLIVIDGLQIPYFQDLGMIACLDNYIDEDMKNDVLPSVWSEVTYDGGLYGVAQFDSGMAMWTRKSILEKIGARIPTSYKDAWTVEEFEDILAKCKEIGYEYPLYIRQNKTSSLYFTWMAVIASFGGDYLNRDTMLATGTMDGENTVAAISTRPAITRMRSMAATRPPSPCSATGNTASMSRRSATTRSSFRFRISATACSPAPALRWT